MAEKKKRKYKPSDFQGAIRKHHPNMPHYLEGYALPLLDMNHATTFDSFERKITQVMWNVPSAEILRKYWDELLKTVECAERLNQEVT